VLVIVAAVGMVLAASVTRPVRRLQSAAHRLAAGDLTVRVDTDDGPPELRQLAATFNATAEQLATLMESQRRFVADASHQLRTPLTALRLRLETLGPLVPGTAQPKLAAAIAETNRLSRLVHSLLVLARSDASTTPCEEVDLSAALRDRADSWRPVVDEAGVDLVEDCPAVLRVDAVPGAIEQVLDNLISNALAVAPPGTSITLRAAREDGAVGLHVVDQGPGLPTEARARAFERFWRPQPEAAGRAGEGFGLGLAIVDQLARHCGGHAELVPGPGGGGLDAVVTLHAR
jgi:signal transduction histidine kinase